MLSKISCDKNLEEIKMTVKTKYQERNMKILFIQSNFLKLYETNKKCYDKKKFKTKYKK